MTEAERQTRHDAEITAFHELMGDAYRRWRDALPHAPSEWLLAVRAAHVRKPANDDAPIPANDNIDMDEAA